MKLNENGNYEVIVIGGGPSGCAAAAVAARQGAKVLLIEATYTLGGMGTNGLVSCFAPSGDGEKRISCGIAEELILKSNAIARYTEDDTIGWAHSSPEDLKRLYDELVLNSGAEILFGSIVCGAEATNGRISSITVANKLGLTKYQAKIFIDCTGDGDVAMQAGASFAHGGDSGELQPATLCFVLTNVNMEAYEKIAPFMHHSCPQSPVHKILANKEKYPLLIDDFMTVDLLWPGTVSFNSGHITESNSTDLQQMGRSIIRGRKLAKQFRDALAEVEPEAFGDAYLIQTAPVLGIRESRRIEGEYTLTVQDYIERRSFDDEIARNSYYIDVHSNKKLLNNEAEFRKDEIRYKKGESHGIPFRCLIPKGIDNLLVAGKIISCDRLVMGAIRVMPNCLTTGEAAGVAAALSLKNNGSVRAIDVKELRTVLRENGAYFI